MHDGFLGFAPGGAASITDEQLQAAVGAAFALRRDGPARSQRRTWLDTFDWRLRRAGLTLEQLGTGAKAQLVLTGRDGGQLATCPVAAGPAGAAVSWPSLVGDLPAGQLRKLLAPAAGIRAIAPVARAVSREREHRVLNADGKTIARLTVEQLTVSYPARAQAPARLWLTPVRGYRTQAGKAAAALRAGLDLRPGTQAALTAALAAAGSGATGSPAGAALSAEMPAPSAAAAVLAGLLDVLVANVPGTIRDTDTEFLHDLRIAVRRVRSVLKLTGDALPAGLADTFRAEFSWLGDLTTPSRDLDVYLLGYPAMTASLLAASPAELAPFHQYLTRARARERRKLLRGLRSARFGRLISGLRAALDAVPADGSRPTAGELAARKIDTARRRALRAGRRVVPGCPAENLHNLRKRCKELRYLVEMFGPLYEPVQRAAAIRELKALQDCLGDFQDAEVQRDEIRLFAETMLAERSAPATTLLALGEVSAGLAARQHTARAKFDRAFADFASAASQARLSALTQAPRTRAAAPRAAA